MELEVRVADVTLSMVFAYAGDKVDRRTLRINANAIGFCCHCIGTCYQETRTEYHAGAKRYP